TSAIPRVAEANTGNFFQRLMYITGNRFSFDLPTEVMAEIAIRAGNGGKYFWTGWDDTDISHYVIANNDFGNMTAAVGLKLPNAWGLYDVSGNAYEWCLDDDSVTYVKNAGIFIPAWNSSTNRRYRGGGSYDAYWSSQPENFRAGVRGKADASNANSHRGFRVFWIVD
ncbi:MAG: formylglycine-generating enzyme family protein, partial [Lentisphaerae bacterium]|nr:formylglycine-generating enzyme family protein [Lentisphaerota bacterium]